MGTHWTIRELATDAEIASAFPVMRQLRPNQLDAPSFVETVLRLRAGGYRLHAACDGERIVGLAGWRFGEHLHWGKHIYVDDLVTDEAARSTGAGRALIGWLKETGRAAGCVQMHLDSGVQRFRAHRFYLREGFDITSHHFAMPL